MIINEKMNLSHEDLIIETGKIAKQASSCTVQYGETIVLVSVTCDLKSDKKFNFLPMSVDYREKYYASGRIPGGFFKREARPSEREIIAARITDRPLRPLFPEEFQKETIVSINVLSYDEENEPELLGTIGASMCLGMSDIPWNGPVASVRVGKIDGKLKINPTNSELADSPIEIIVSGTEDSIVMVEGECDFISEEEFLTTMQYAHEAIKDIVKLQNKIIKKIGKVKYKLVKSELSEQVNAACKKIEKDLTKKVLEDLNKPKAKFDRYEDIDSYCNKAMESFQGDEFDDSDKSHLLGHINHIINEDLRNKTLNAKRADGRKLDEVRNIDLETSLLPRAHGSGLFTRGETQALVVATLGNKRDEQMLDDISGLSYKNFILHYNFPPFCVGEARPKFSVSRREIGHGNLAERSIKKSLPKYDDFPYTIRIVSEILESNGSSSMATVCGSTLALIDAGVPIKTPIAGVAMGLIMDSEKKYAILTDILGTEDHLGDMDFKVAGSRDGITAIQMDLKIDGLPMKIMEEALEQARRARIHILDEMDKHINKLNPELSKYAPKVVLAHIPPDRIGEFIGPGGKNIKKMEEEYQCSFNIDDDGKCAVMGIDMDKVQSAVEYIKFAFKEAEVGNSYEGEIVRILDFGAFVKVSPSIEGLIHISELKWEHVKKVRDVVNIGDSVKVKLIKKDDKNRLNFSIKALLKREKTKEK